jgi:membrane fusion protein, multidrug efflux system
MQKSKSTPFCFAPKKSLVSVCVASCLLIAGCSGPPAAAGGRPLPEVIVQKIQAVPVVLVEDYIAQTEAVDTVEIRPRVSGLLEKQVYTDGDRIAKNDVLFILDQQPFVTALAQARAVLAQAEAAKVNSAATLVRIKGLVADQAASQQDLDNAIARERADVASVDAARASMHSAELNLTYTTIRASRAGVMSKALIKPGSLVTASQTVLTTLYSVNPMYVNFTISEQKLFEVTKRIKRIPGENKDLAPPFKLKLVDGTEYKFSGKLDFVDAAIDPKSGTLQMRVAVPNPDRTLRAGQFVRVEVPAYENPAGIRVPQKAVIETQGNRTVLVVGAENKVERRAINASARIEQDWIVTSGLKPDELIIIDGIQKAQPGSVVKPIFASDATTPAKPTTPAAVPTKAPAKGS